MPIIPVDNLLFQIQQQQQKIRELEEENAKLVAALDGKLVDSYVDELQEMIDEYPDEKDFTLVASIAEH